MNEIIAYAVSNIGNVRDNHEDNLFIPKDSYINEDLQKKIKQNDYIVEYDFCGTEGVFAICDGMGGHNAGEVASRIAAETIAKNYDNLLSYDKSKLLGFIKELNNTICDNSNNNINYKNMGTTFSCIILSKDSAYLLHAGDSKIYKFVNNTLEQISRDHNEGTRLIEAGIIKKEDINKFPNRKSLYKYLGRNGELIADCEKIDCPNGARFILSSDGLSDVLNEEEIKRVLIENKSAKDTCKQLLDICLSKGEFCSDNVTIICIDIK